MADVCNSVVESIDVAVIVLHRASISFSWMAINKPSQGVLCSI